MRTRSRRPAGLIVFVVLALATSVLSVATGSIPAAAVEVPPTFISTWGTAGSGNGQFSGPEGVAVDPTTGDVYVTDTFNHRVQKFTASGTYLTQWGTEGSGNGQFDTPGGLAVDPTTGDVIVADTWNNRVQRFSSTGTYLDQWGTEVGDGQLTSPGWVAVDSEGDVYVTSSNRVLTFTSTGDYLTQWNSPQSYENGHPEGLAVDSDGDVYVALTSGDLNFPGNINVLRKYTSTGSYVTQWGGYGTGTGQFIRPTGVAVDGSGDVYVTDTGNHRVQRFTSGGTFLTQWGASGSGNGRFSWAAGLAVDPAGDVYVADSSDNRVQRFGIRGRPDGRIRRGTGLQVGNDVYNTTGVNQTRSGSAARGHSVTYTASVQNDAGFAETLRLKGQPSTSSFTVVYRSAGANITPQVTAGTYTTRSLPTGAALPITITVTVRTTAPRHASLARTLTATSTTHPTYKDTVKFVTTRA